MVWMIKLLTDALSPTTSLLGGLTNMVLPTFTAGALYARTEFYDREHVSKCSEPEFSFIKWDECSRACFKVEHNKRCPVHQHGQDERKP